MRLSAAVLILAPLGPACTAEKNTPPLHAAKPNIVLIYADDLGYGDAACYGGKIPTPQIDALAASGLRFTAGYCASATCTPSRFALMTGSLPWRKQGTGVLQGDAALIIDPNATTLPAQLKAAGYATAAIGKWHLGLGDGKQPLDWNKPIAPGANEVGFDRSFLIPATVDRVPCVFVADGRVVGLDPADPIRIDYRKKVGGEPTGKEHPELLKMGLTYGHDDTLINGISRIGWMDGGKDARWVDEDIADVMVAQADRFIEQSKDRPFFLYFATHDVHVPRAPHARFAGKSGRGPRGDAVVQLDWQVGAIREALKKRGLLDNTLILFSSDNGPVLDDGYADQAVEKLGDHTPSGPWKGGKYTFHEGGNRVPLVVSWPGRVKPGTTDALVGQVDFLASFSRLAGAPPLPQDAAPDSLDVLPALLGDSRSGRSWILEHAQRQGNALRMGDWKFMPEAKNQAGSGARLYRLDQDPGETRNLIREYPDKAMEMARCLRIFEASKQTR